MVVIRDSRNPNVTRVLTPSRLEKGPKKSAEMRAKTANQPFLTSARKKLGRFKWRRSFFKVEIKDIVKPALKDVVKGMPNGEVAVGYFNTNPEILSRAWENEFSGHIFFTDAKGQNRELVPRRPFMGHAWDENLEELKLFVRKQLELSTTSMLTSTEAFAAIGDKIRDNIVHAIDTAKEWAVPLAQLTISMKGHDKPLVETYTMRNSVEYKITETSSKTVKKLDKLFK